MAPGGGRRAVGDAATLERGARQHLLESPRGDRFRVGGDSDAPFARQPGELGAGALAGPIELGHFCVRAVLREACARLPGFDSHRAGSLSGIVRGYVLACTVGTDAVIAQASSYGSRSGRALREMFLHSWKKTRFREAVPALQFLSGDGTPASGETKAGSGYAVSRQFPTPETHRPGGPWLCER